MRALRPACLLLTLTFTLTVLAGCVTTDDVDPTLPPATGPLLVAGNHTASHGAPLIWNGTASEHDGGPCAAPTCFEHTFTLEIPDGYWTTEQGALELSVRWPRDDTSRVRATFSGPDGQLGGSMATWYAETLLVDTPQPGTYTIRVEGARAEGPYWAVAQIERPITSDTPVDLLPDFMTMTPIHLRIEYRGFLPGGDVLETAGIRGCDPWEIVEQQARRCLRFTNALGNVGQGPLEVRLKFDQAAQGLTPLGGTFIQRIFDTNGEYRELPVGRATFHGAHAHYHYEGFARFWLYEYDETTGDIGPEVGKGHKSGFCFFDIGLVEPGMNHTTLPIYRDEASCLNPSPDREWITGLSPNWFDQYHHYLTDQYVELTNVPDGVYKLVSRANADDTLLETDTTNNEAHVIFRLTGDHIEVLEPTGDETL